ncbi:hypothetical protein AUP68_09842 [Ilyonectria robusta]
MPKSMQPMIGLTAMMPTVTLLALTFFLLVISQIVYYTFFHPLAKYPGPAIAKFTNLWKAYQLWSLHMPETLTQLHDKYGEVVRVGPNDLSFNGGKASAQIYKAGRGLPKTKFYNGFTTFNPNLFGTQDEEIHSIRRRQMAHAFSLQSIRGMESYIDTHLLQLRKNLDHYVKTEEVFDLKELIAFYVLDVLGELAFSRSFNSQVEQDSEKLPPINDHIYLSCLLGMMPEMMPFLKVVAAWTPLPWFQGLFRARKLLKNLTAECVSHRMREKISNRKDLLTCLINAVDPETGAILTELDIHTEAFAMILNHVVHHNPSIWGSDHDKFDPSRFLGPKADFFKRHLTPFSIGHRMCIGKNMAMTNILKVLTTVLKHYQLEMMDPKQKISTISVGISEKDGPLECRVRRRILSDAS